MHDKVILRSHVAMAMFTDDGKDVNDSLPNVTASRPAQLCLVSP